MSSSADDIEVLVSLNGFTADGLNYRTPCAFIRAIRTGAPGTRHRITVHGVPADITIGTRAPLDPGREAASFKQLWNAMEAATTDGIQPELPAEIGMVVWEHEGREIRVCAPGTAPALRRARDRVRRRLSALSPLPLLGALSQPLTGSATAVGVLVAPAAPPMHHHLEAPPPPVVWRMDGDIARPAPPFQVGSITFPGLPGLTAPALPTLPAPEQATPDTSTPPPAEPAPTFRRRTSPTPSPSGDTPAPVEPSPLVTGGDLTVTAPAETPSTSTPGKPTVTTKASAKPTVSPLRKPLQPRHEHHRKTKRHPLRGLHLGR